MDGNQIIPVIVMLLGLLLGAGIFIVVPQRRRRRARTPVHQATEQKPVGVEDSLDSVMRALTLVQHRYAALVRLHDQTLTQLRETEIERDHWKRQALGGGKNL